MHHTITIRFLLHQYLPHNSHTIIAHFLQNFQGSTYFILIFYCRHLITFSTPYSQGIHSRPQYFARFLISRVKTHLFLFCRVLATRETSRWGALELLSSWMFEKQLRGLCWRRPLECDLFRAAESVPPNMSHREKTCNSPLSWPSLPRARSRMHRKSKKE